MKAKIVKWLKRIFLFLLLAVISVWGIDKWVSYKTKDLIYSNVATIPHNKVGLLLGSSKYVRGGYINLFYKYRIEAAIALFKAGKIDYILVSGDNGTKQYNEPEMMQADLEAAGIPKDRIYLDFAGFRTLDSILRSKAIFGCDKVTIISQRFHNERAAYIALDNEMKAIAYNAKDVYPKYAIKVLIREKFARVKMLLDLMINKQPKFYGPKIEID